MIQNSTKRVPFALRRLRLTYVGLERLDLPVGQVEAHHLLLTDEIGEIHSGSWFAAEGSAPWMHVMVQELHPDGVSYRLAALERTAYWER